MVDYLAEFKARTSGQHTDELCREAIKMRTPLLRSAARASRGTQLAEDAYQASLEQLIRGRDRYATAEIRNIPAWLHTVVRNQALRQLRATATEQPQPDSVREALERPSGDLVEHEILGRALVLQQLKDFARLKPAEQQALIDKESGLSRREISEKHGWSQTKVNRLLTEGRQQLRTMRVTGQY